MGRRTKLTPQLQATFITALREGSYAVTACEMVGINTDTYHTWVRKGEEGREPYADFAAAVKEAKAHAEHKMVNVIRRAAEEPQRWQAAAWWLERTKPHRWGRVDRQEVQLTGKDGGPVTVTNARETLEGLLGEPKPTDPAA